MEEWNPGAVYTSAIVLVAATSIWLLLSLRSSLLLKKRLLGRPPLPPGSSGLPLIGDTFRFFKAQSRLGGLHHFFKSKIDTFGPVFRMNLLFHPTVVVSSASGFKPLFAREGTVVENSWPSSIVAILGPDSLSLKRGEDHKAFRRHLGMCLGHTAVVGYLGDMERVAVKQFAEHWEGREEVGATEMVKKFTFSLIAFLLLSLEEGSKLDRLASLFAIMSHGMLKIPIDLPGFALHESLKAGREIRAMLGEMMDKRREELRDGSATDKARRDFLSRLLTVEGENGRTCSDGEVKDNLLLLLFAGYDTSTSALSLVMYFLALNPHVYERLLEEHKGIAAEKKEGEGLTVEDVTQRMPYTWNVLRETMRLTPPVVGTFREAIADFELNGCTVLKGWKLMWTNQAIHFDPEIFPNPHVFDPSRFEGEELPPYSWIAFGGGVRLCPGNEFARWEMTVFVHHLVKNYRWSLVNPNERIAYDPMPCGEKGLRIRVTKCSAF